MWESNRCVYVYKATWGLHIHAAKFALIQTSQHPLKQLCSFPSTTIKLTLKERWNPVTSVILFCTILLRFGLFFGGFVAAAVVFGISICSLPKQKVVSESRKWSHCAGWWACYGALNGSPVDNTKHRSVSVTTHITRTNHWTANLLITTVSPRFTKSLLKKTDYSR